MDASPPYIGFLSPISPMHEIARTILARYLETQRVPTLDEVGLSDHALATAKHLVFVTLYLDGAVVASSGRVHIKKNSSALELIEHTLLCLKDERIAQHLGDSTLLDRLQIRVDTIATDARKIITDLTDVDPRWHGLILIAEKYETLAVVLPRMSAVAETADDLFFLVAKKAGLDPDTLDWDDIILYRIETESESDF